MNPRIVNLAALALMPAAALIVTSCSSTPKGVETRAATYQPGVPGGVVVQTYQTTATVTAINPETRKITLVSPDGSKTIVKAGPEVANFNQIHLGDKLKFTVAEELVVYLASSSAPPSDGGATLVALAPIGAKPGVLMADTVQVTAKVTAIDLKERKATLQFPDGTVKKVAVRSDVDLTQRKVGEEVVIRTTEAFAIVVEKP